MQLAQVIHLIKQRYRWTQLCVISIDMCAFGCLGVSLNPFAILFIKQCTQSITDNVNELRKLNACCQMVSTI